VLFGRWLLVFGIAIAAGLLAFALLRHLSYPLLWHDESETAVFAERILDYGYPKIRGPKNVIYSLWHRGGVGVYEDWDAYTGSPWAQYYVGALGAAGALGSDDFYAKTLRLRLPFALLGAAGLLLLLFAVLPAAGASPEARLGFALFFLALSCVSISLLLHLREARHPALTVFLMGAVLFVDLRRRIFDQLGPASHALLLALLLILLFNAFFPAFVILALAIGLREAAHTLRRPGSILERATSLLKHSAGLWLAALVVLPLLGFFDFLDQTRGWVERFSLPDAWATNLGFVAATLLRFEFLAPALALRATLVAMRVSSAERSSDPGLRQRLEITSFLLLLTILYAIVIARTPFLFERYFVVLGPLLICMLLLDALSLGSLLRRPEVAGSRRSLGVAGAGVTALCFLVSLGVRGPELSGHLEALREPYRGPLDFAIPYLAERHPDIADRVIATNYEEPAFIYYLGSKVTVGFYGANLDEDLTIQPDVIVPRPWPDHLDTLKSLADAADYESVAFPVANLWWNNIPGLNPRGERKVGHQFRTRIAEKGEPQLVILERRGPSAP
jgi:hypothetical protein